MLLFARSVEMLGATRASTLSVVVPVMGLITSALLLGETIGTNFRNTVARFPDRLALIARQQGVRWTYAEMLAHAENVAANFLAAGSSRASVSASGRPTTPNGR